MRVLPWVAAAAVAAGLAACRRTHVEVVTEVGPFGTAIRTVTIRSSDDGNAADLPENLRLPRGAYAVLEEGQGLFRAVASFSDAAQAASPFAFVAEGMERSASSATAFRCTDWLLFRHYAYSETVHDAVEEQEIQSALDDAAETVAQLTEASFRELLGPDYDQTVLHARFGDDLRRMLRELAFLCWRELQGLDAAGGEAALRSSLARVCTLLRRYGLELRPEWLERWAAGEADAGVPAEVRDAVAAWVAPALQPRAPEGGRQVVVPNVQSLLFDGPFAQEFRRRMDVRFGGPQGSERWVQGMLARVFGLFGQMSIFSLDELEFTLRVRMPGTLLRSNGYLGLDSSFVQFQARAAYPRGAGLSCESVLWDYGAMQALRARVQPLNETAVAWMNLVGAGEGMERRPVGALLGTLRRCVQDNSPALLEEVAAQGGEAGAQAAQVLAWLRAEG
ncbi:MAG: hypothetical protein EYC70_16400 [Planctomycetota bacterium]|nr:MAG: hypothetical protein EYC70_16400 [Planctomycetota bacterium]